MNDNDSLDKDEKESYGEKRLKVIFGIGVNKDSMFERFYRFFMNFLFFAFILVSVICILAIILRV